MHSMLVKTPSAAARFSLSAAEFKECSSVNGLGKDTEKYGKDTEKYVLLLGTVLLLGSSLL